MSGLSDLLAPLLKEARIAQSKLQSLGSAQSDAAHAVAAIECLLADLAAYHVALNEAPAIPVDRLNSCNDE